MEADFSTIQYRIEWPFHEILLSLLLSIVTEEILSNEYFSFFNRFFGKGTHLARQSALIEVYTRIFDCEPAGHICLAPDLSRHSTANNLTPWMLTGQKYRWPDLTRHAVMTQRIF